MKSEESNHRDMNKKDLKKLSKPELIKMLLKLKAEKINQKSPLLMTNRKRYIITKTCSMMIHFPKLHLFHSKKG